MLSLIQFLEEIEANHRTVTIPPAEVERLVMRYGPRVRSAGRWNRSGDGSVEVPMSHITMAVERLGDRTLAEALEQLKTPEGRSHRDAAAEQLIELLADMYLQQFQKKVERFQNSQDPAEVEGLQQEIGQELFGS